MERSPHLQGFAGYPGLLADASRASLSALQEISLTTGVLAHNPVLSANAVAETVGLAAAAAAAMSKGALQQQIT
jgi:hypothetical protein